MSASYSERERLFSSSSFKAQVADRLELENNLVISAIEAVLGAGLIPCRLSRNDRALAVDGATILAAIGGRQSTKDSIVRVGAKLCAMTMQQEAGNADGHGVASIFPILPSICFETDLAEVLLNLWRIARKPSNGFKGVTVGIFWTDVLGSIAYGAIEQPSEGRRRIYASRRHPVLSDAGSWDSVRSSAVGGIIYSARSIMRFGALLEGSVEDTEAAI